MSASFHELGELQILNITTKVITKRFWRADKLGRKVYCDMMLSGAFALDTFVFIDEAAKNNMSDIRGYGRARMGKRAYCTDLFGRGVRYNLYVLFPPFFLLCLFV